MCGWFASKPHHGLSCTSLWTAPIPETAALRRSLQDWSASLPPAGEGWRKNPVDRLLGEELCVLAWAVERMNLDRIPVAVRNRVALRPEERWWLFGMTAMGTGGVLDAGRGWRAALEHALGDVVQSEMLEIRAHRSQRLHEDSQPRLNLFGDDPL
ncbi:DUF3780 domain-containing protein [Chloracidobacterium thermophilum]|nr:DUF3780 domain-containing protein [Chloracidobacterium thermophilum]QUV83006.1 DUF3780 domain-containing protein [Chloracidobacterium sp. D]